MKKDPNNSSTQKPSLVFVSHYWNIVGGAERSLLSLITDTKSRGIAQHIILPKDGEFADELDRLNIPYTVIGQPWWVHSPNDTSHMLDINPTPTKNVIFEILELLLTLKPTLTITNTLTIPWLAYASAIAGIKHMWIIREISSDNKNFSFSIGERSALRSIDQLSDKVFSNSKSTASYYSNKFITNTDVGIVYPYVPSPIITKSISPYQGNTLKLVVVGQIQKHKGQLDAVRALKRLLNKNINAQLVLVGKDEDVDYSSRIRSYVKNHHMEDSVIFHGFSDNPSSIVQHSDIVLVPSLNEPFGRVTVEAMLLNKPVIGKNSGGTAEIISHGISGLLYEDGDIEGLTDNIILLNNDQNLQKKISLQGYKKAKSSYSLRSCHKEFFDYINYMDNYDNRALDLSPLKVIYNDYKDLKYNNGNLLADLEMTKSSLENNRKEISNIKTSRSWKIARTIQSVRKAIFRLN